MNGFNLLDYLCVGKPNAIKNKELATLLSTNERCITIAVNALRKRGEIICSDANGFYLPADDEDIKDFVKMMHSRMLDMQLATKPAEEYLQKRGESVGRT